MSLPPVAAAVLAYNGRVFLERCLESVLAQDPPPAEVVVVDNASTDGSADLVASQFPQIRLVRNSTNLGVAEGLNTAVGATSAPLVALLNQDVELYPGCLAALVEPFGGAELPVVDPVGVVGAKLLYPGGEVVQHAGGRLAMPLFLAEHVGYGEADDERWDTPPARERPASPFIGGGGPTADALDYVTGAVFAVRRDMWEALGGMDPLFSPAYFEEVDFCLRAWARGWQVRLAPRATAIHYESTTLGRGSRVYLGLYHRNRLRLALRHASLPHLLTTFARAEMRRTASLRHVATAEGAAQEVAALAAAYTDAAERVTELAEARADAPLTAGAVWALRDMLGALRHVAEQSAALDEWKQVALPTPGLLHARDLLLAAERVEGGGDTGAGEVGRLTREADARARVAEAQAHAVVREQPFVSNARGVGPLIVGLRSAWNWMATKWYVRPLVAQQNHFNAAAAASLAALLAQAERQAEVGRITSAAVRELVTELERLRTAHEELRHDYEGRAGHEDERHVSLRAQIEATAQRLEAVAERLASDERADATRADATPSEAEA